MSGFKKRPITEEQFIRGGTGEEVVAVKEEVKKETVYTMNVRIPESLWLQFNAYIETKASRRESKNQVLLDALTRHLNERMP